MKKSFQIFLFSVLFFSYFIKGKHALSQSIQDTSKSFKREINNNFYYSLITQAQNFLGVMNLGNGYEDFHLRIWRNAGALLEVTSIYNKDSKWTATFADLTVNFAPNSSDWIFKYIGTRDLSPRSGWTAFSVALFETKLMTLPDESKLPKYFAISDGEGYCIEIANKHSYRFYTFSNPYFLQKVSTEAKDFVQAMNLISAELKNY